jgi:hypothetical protein
MDVKLAAAMSQMVKPKPIVRAKNGRSFLIILAFAAFMQSKCEGCQYEVDWPLPPPNWPGGSTRVLT